MDARDQRDNPWLPIWLPVGPQARRSRSSKRSAPHPVPAPMATRLWADAGDGRVTPPPPDRELPVWSEPVRAHLGGRTEDWTRAGWWWLGAHGGTGVTTLHQLIPGGADARWRR